jgi:hypothetical protein
MASSDTVLAEVTDVLSVPAGWLVKYEPGDIDGARVAQRSDVPPGAAGRSTAKRLV